MWKARLAFAGLWLGIALPACTVGDYADSGDPSDELDDPADPNVVEVMPELPAELFDQTSTKPLVAESGVNLLGNASFEAPLGNTATDAYQNWVHDGAAARSSARRLQGTWSLRVPATSSTLETAGYQLIHINGNGHYRAQIFAQVATTGPRRQRLYAVYYDLFGHVVQNQSIPVSKQNGEWHSETLDTIAPGGAWYLVVNVGKLFKCASGCDAGTAYYDDSWVSSM